jgi:ribA/ribD-fused uncharacterized protein
MELFYGSKDVYSNFYRASFVIDDIQYNCVEQYFQYQKAITFGAYETAEKILNTTSPTVQKSLGRKSIPNFNGKIWNSISTISTKSMCIDVMQKGLMAKFSQNPELKRILLETDEKILVEAAPRDLFWGAGYGKTNPNILDPKKWRGQNRLGFELMRTRKLIRECQLLNKNIGKTQSFSNV